MTERSLSGVGRVAGYLDGARVLLGLRDEGIAADVVAAVEQARRVEHHHGALVGAAHQHARAGALRAPHQLVEPEPPPHQQYLGVTFRTRFHWLRPRFGSQVSTSYLKS